MKYKKWLQISSLCAGILTVGVFSPSQANAQENKAKLQAHIEEKNIDSIAAFSVSKQVGEEKKSNLSVGFRAEENQMEQAVHQALYGEGGDFFKLLGFEEDYFVMAIPEKFVDENGVAHFNNGFFIERDAYFWGVHYNIKKDVDGKIVAELYYNWDETPVTFGTDEIRAYAKKEQAKDYQELVSIFVSHVALSASIK